MINNTGLTVYRTIPHFSFKIPKSGLTSALSSHLVGDALFLPSHVADKLYLHICNLQIKTASLFLAAGCKKDL